MTAPTPEQMRALASELSGIEFAVPEQTGQRVLAAQQVLRAAADEVDRLRAERNSWSEQAIETAEVLGKTGIELDRLRAVIEKAPHAYECFADFAQGTKCTCWKAEVL